VAAATTAANNVQRAGEAGARHQAESAAAAESLRQAEGLAVQFRRGADRTGLGI